MPQTLYRKIEALESMDRAEEEADLFDLDDECLNEIEIEFDKREVYIPLYDAEEVNEDNLIEPIEFVAIANVLSEVFEIQHLTAYRRTDSDGLWVEEESLS